MCPAYNRDSITDLQRQMNPESRTMLPKMAFTGFASRYREPTVDEGFDDITKVNFKVRCCLVWPCWRLRWDVAHIGPRSATCSSMGPSLTSINSSTGQKRRRPNGASSGYREQSQYVRKQKGKKESWLQDSLAASACRATSTSDSNAGSLTLLTTTKYH
jgi:hypothetical protein